MSEKSKPQRGPRQINESTVLPTKQTQAPMPKVAPPKPPKSDKK